MPPMDPWEGHAIRRPHLPERVTVYEVGPRDGLQNEKETLSVEVRAEFVDRLTDAGLPAIEVGSFVSPTAIPQLADTEELFRPHPSATRRAVSGAGSQHAGASSARSRSAVREIAVFTAASETFNRKNINAGVDESIERFRPSSRARGRRRSACAATSRRRLAARTKERSRPRRCAKSSTSCSTSRSTRSRSATRSASRHPPGVYDVIEALYESGVTRGVLALHFHDTRGTALANVYAGSSAA